MKILQALKTKKISKELILTFSFIILLVLVLLAVFIFAKNVDKKEQEEKVVEEVVVEKVNPFESITIEAKAGIVKDLNSNKVYFTKNINQALPLASLTKLMTTLVAYENLNEDSLIQFSFEDLATEGESAIYAGEQFSAKDLIDFTLVSSSNDAATALASHTGQVLNKNRGLSQSSLKTFIEEMNAFALKIGMRNSSFYNETGLDKSSIEAGASGSINDLTLLTEYIIKNHPKLLEASKEKSILTISKQGLQHNTNNTNDIVNILPNILGSKTGYTDLAGGNLVVVIDPGLNTPILIAVLGSSKEGRFTDVKKLSDTLLEYFSSEQ